MTVPAFATPPDPAPNAIMRMLPGLAISAAIAAAAMALGSISWLQTHGMSALTVAIVLGMLAGNTVYPRFAGSCGPGVDFSKRTLLRLGVVLYGLRLTVQDITTVGWGGVITDALVLGSTFALACWIGVKWLGVDRNTAMLIGAGSGICGAAAVMAAEPVVRARAEQVTVAVATVVVFGTIAIFLYPVLYHLNQQWHVIPGGVEEFGIYIGTTVHEVAQVVAAGRSVAPDAADTAVIAKMVRVMMLAPFLILLAAWLTREDKAALPDGAVHEKARVPVPWFAFAFVGVVLFNSLRLLPAASEDIATEIDTVLLVMAMGALGLSTHLSAIRKAGIKPLLLALILFAWLVVGGAVMNRWLYQWLG